MPSEVECQHRPAEPESKVERPKPYPFSSQRMYYFAEDADAFMDYQARRIAELEAQLNERGGGSR